MDTQRTQYKTVDDLRVELFAYTETAIVHGVDADFMPCSTARVSHGQEDKTGKDIDADRKLMNYLADHRHMSPFEHQSVSILVEAPLFVAREWMRHRTQSFNEISMRYTSDPSGTYWLPAKFRKQAAKNKQSSAGVLSVEDNDYCRRMVMLSIDASVHTYDCLLSKGVCREQARTVLPVGMITRFIATANLRNWAHWFALRIDDAAQEEIRHFARKVDAHLSAIYPESWSVLTKHINRE